ncbi:MAG: Hsp20/alpha crystallin family protein [bacterium]
MADNPRNVQAGEGAERGAEKYYVPQADVYETENDVTIKLDMPGVSKDDLEITVDNNDLRIVGRVRQERTEGYTPLMREYRVGDYRRTFTLSNAIDRDKVEAKLHNGVLTITLAKSERVKPRIIEIQRG